MEKLYLGTDLGGTTVLSGVVDSCGGILSRVSLPTPHGSGAIASAIAESSSRACREAGVSISDIASLGVGVPGAVEGEAVLKACNLDMYDYPLGGYLSSILNLPVHLENDANCAAMGEYLSGCGRDASSLLCVTLGTGIGGGFIANGRLWRGANGCALEPGHMVIHRGGRMCACSRRGCFEAYASTAALVRGCEEYIAQYPNSICASLGGQMDGRTVFRAIDAGDEGAKALFDEYTQNLACGLTNLVNLFQPEILCIGGGISAQGERLLSPLRRILEREDYARFEGSKTKLVTAALGNDAGLVGAAHIEKFI
ncbi:MAG: ROK family protein [Candidatus Heteroscillospira sp.]|jgi:glucokinase